MERLSVWVSTGLLSAGVSAAVLAGAGVAVADDATAGNTEGSSTNAASGPASDSPDSGSPVSGPTTDPDTKADAATDNDANDDAVIEAAPAPEPEPEAQTPADDHEDTVAEAPKKPKRHLFARAAGSTSLKPRSAAVTASAPEPAAAEVSSPAAADPPAVLTPHAADISSALAPSAGPGASLALAAVPAQTAPVQAAAAPGGSLFRWIAGVTDSVMRAIGGLAINSLQALEALLAGPPSLPAKSTVTVRNSTISLSNGQRLKANWYYPEGDTVPDKLIVLQHGFLALGPMYSHTAANLAEATGAIVVTPSIPSNFFDRNDRWLGGEDTAMAIADLFTGDRKALNDSALAAGFATRYGLDPATAKLPVKFGLAGHSLGGQLVSAAAGYLVDKDAAGDLVGVITLDGVPTGDTMANALRKLQDYEDVTGRYIPVREIGAPSNAFNSVSNVKQALNEARPGRFNGVVLSGGVHMDSMRGGNPIIQFAAYLIAGFPKSQNQAAVDMLSATWFTDWFAGDTDNGDELAPGSAISISTPKGTSNGVVIGSAPVPAARFVTLAV
ncbi:alpha/beta hydrolase [Mycobacterium sp. AMU20-3851]|uniref:alpha/beta hydrolase n=1 Tax=Mycobacterium sp. AMU20-3851 TaxID=3122055 RepID=UPI0037543993